MTPECPCSSFWDWGHWAPDCPCTKNGLAPLDDPCQANTAWKPKKSSVLSNRLQILNKSLASISAPPEKSEDVVVDTCATNHVTSRRDIFVSWKPTNIWLCVALEECLPVEGISDIMIKSSVGDLWLSNVLLCSRVSGTVLSVGFFDCWESSVLFNNG